MDQPELGDRLTRLERRNRILGFGLAGCAIVAVIALVAALRALIPILRVQSALRAVFSSNQSIAARSEPEPAATQPASEQPQPQANKLLAVVGVNVKAKRLLPKDYDAGRYHAEVELTLLGENHSDRAVRAYQGTLDVQDLLGNRIILLSVQSQTPLTAHHTQQFNQFFEINQFENKELNFAAEQFENLVFKWQPGKIVFADGTNIEAGQ
jgi:hypothetical protein